MFSLPALLRSSPWTSGSSLGKMWRVGWLRQLDLNRTDRKEPCSFIWVNTAGCVRRVRKSFLWGTASLHLFSCWVKCYKDIFQLIKGALSLNHLTCTAPTNLKMGRTTTREEILTIFQFSKISYSEILCRWKLSSELYNVNQQLHANWKYYPKFGDLETPANSIP